MTSLLRHSSASCLLLGPRGGYGLAIGVSILASLAVIHLSSGSGSSDPVNDYMGPGAVGLRGLVSPPSSSSRAAVSVPRRSAMVGLRNAASLCFLNSVLQGLSSLPPLMTFLDAVVSAKAVAEAGMTGQHSEAPLSGLLRECLKGLRGEGEITSSCLRSWGGKLDSSAILKVVRASKPHFSDSHTQQDAQELLNAILDVLSEEFQALCPEIPTKAATPFTGKLGGSLTCVKCGRERETKAEEFCELSLAPCYSVEASLERFVSPEMVEGVECRNCYIMMHARRILASIKEMEVYNSGGLNGEIKEKRAQLDSLSGVDVDGDGALPKFCEGPTTVPRCTFLKKLVVKDPPEILCLHVQRRFNEKGGMVKDRSRVAFGQELDFGRFCKVENVKYELLCVLEHLGGQGSGHYVSYKRGDDGGWIYCSDEVVKEVNEGRVWGREVFLLIYRMLKEDYT